MKPRRVIGGLVCVFALIAVTLTGCAWLGSLFGSHRADPNTLAHLQSIAAAGTVSAESCSTYVDYEKSRRHEDPKSLRNMEQICDCFKNLDPAVPIAVKTCTTEVRSAIIYEQDKTK
jgi:hypothetical protein